MKVRQRAGHLRLPGSPVRAASGRCTRSATTCASLAISGSPLQRGPDRRSGRPQEPEADAAKPTCDDVAAPTTSLDPEIPTRCLIGRAAGGFRPTLLAASRACPTHSPVSEPERGTQGYRGTLWCLARGLRSGASASRKCRIEVT